jgi:multiple sugar transport system ATP-binding protein
VTAVTLDTVTKRFTNGTVAVDALDLSINEGEVMVLLGPSGCGKSTVLRLIAGLEEQTEGHVLFGAELADDWSPRERRVAMVFQDFALYPHMSVRDNLSFPLKLSKVQPQTAAERVADLATALGVADTLPRRPGQLSGGQKQRVAMGRAIIRSPEVFLMDEPLSNLDSALRSGLRAEISSLVRGLGVTTVYVTHDQTEALTMADRIAILRDGRLQQLGTPSQVYETPATTFVAAFLGTPRMNLLAATVHGYLDNRVIIDLGLQYLTIPWSDPRARDLARYHGEQIIVGLRAEAVQPVAGDSPGALRGSVRYSEHLGHETIAYLDIGASAAPGIDELTGVGHRPPPAEVTAIKRWRLRGLLPRRGEEAVGVVAPPEEEPDTAAGRHTQHPAEFALRLPPYAKVLDGETMSMRIDPEQLHLFDRRGRRIRYSWER